MDKQKRDAVSKDMLERLLSNRDGRLTGEQWKDLVTEPLVKLLVVALPAGVVMLLTPMGKVIARGALFVFVLVILIMFVPLLPRAWRYARMPVEFSVLYSGAKPRPFWRLWSKHEFYHESGAPIRFNKQLAPNFKVQPNQRYLIYYLEDRKDNVLLSAAPETHPDAEDWHPTFAYEMRYQKREHS